MAVISGPWSLWAPSFGERAIDFARMRRQLLAVGDTLLMLDDVSRGGDRRPVSNRPRAAA
jgi:hypothetical protein